MDKRALNVFLRDVVVYIRPRRKREVSNVLAGVPKIRHSEKFGVYGKCLEEATM